MLNLSCRLLAVVAALACLGLPDRAIAASYAYGAALFPEGSVGRKFIYVDFTVGRSWSHANDYAAAAFGTSLASITSAEEQSAVEDLLDWAGVDPGQPIWFGGRYDCPNTVTFVDGEAFDGYANWASGYPWTGLCGTKRALRLDAGTRRWANTEATNFYGGALALDFSYTATPPTDPGPGPAPVPLPLPAALLGGALFGLGLLRRARRT